MSSQQVVRDMLDCGEICGRILGSHATLFISEEAVHEPAHALDSPLTPNDIRQCVCGDSWRGDVESGFALGFVVDLFATGVMQHDIVREHGAEAEELAIER